MNDHDTDETIDTIFESSILNGKLPSELAGVDSDDSDDEDSASIATPPKIQRLNHDNSKDTKSDCEEDHSSPGAFAAFGKSLCCNDDNCHGLDCSRDTTQSTFLSKYPGINMKSPSEMTLSSVSLKKKKNGKVPSSSRLRLNQPNFHRIQVLRGMISRRLLALQYATVAFIYILLHARSHQRVGTVADFASRRLLAMVQDLSRLLLPFNLMAQLSGMNWILMVLNMLQNLMSLLRNYNSRMNQLKH